MYEIKCDNCKNTLMFDYESTISSCILDLNYTKDPINVIQDRWMTNYLVYKCNNCLKTFKYKFEEVEKKVRAAVSEDVLEFRRVQLFKKIDHSKIDYDNGLLFCGSCRGVDGEGNCFVDIIKQCDIQHGI